MLIETGNIFYAIEFSKLYFSIHSLAKLLKLDIYNPNPNPNPNKLTLLSSRGGIEICSIENH